MKHLSLLLFTSLSLSLAQDLTLKKNNKTVTIKQNQPVVIVTQNSEVFNGRFQKIEDNSIILASSIIDINEIKEIRLQRSRLNSALKGFRNGGLVCGGITAGFFGILSLRQGFELDFFEIYIILVAVPSATFAGGTINAIRYAFKPNEISYIIDRNNWEIIAG